MKKQQLLHELRSTTFAALRSSPVHGIGVFALVDITKGEKEIFSNRNEEWIALSKEEVDALPKTSRSLIENHCLFDETHYFVPEYGFKLMDLSVYLNHSDTPNLISVNEGAYFEALRDIKAGEELLIDYGTIVDCEE